MWKNLSWNILGMFETCLIAPGVLTDSECADAKHETGAPHRRMVTQLGWFCLVAISIVCLDI